MKSVMTAIWLMVVAFGNLIDIIVIAVQSGATGEGMSQVSFSGFSSCTANYHDFYL
jgi:dipeptide/tripeptide permease